MVEAVARDHAEAVRGALRPIDRGILGMVRFRISMAGMLLAVLFSGFVFAALRSGSDIWAQGIYSATAAVLLFAGIAAKHRGVFWHGFAVAGAGYFVIGFGPWIAGPPGSEGRGLNRNLVTAILVDAVVEAVAPPDRPPPGHNSEYYVTRESQKANLRGITHSALTVILAVGGGAIARALAAGARRRAHPVVPPFEPFSDVD